MTLDKLMNIIESIAYVSGNQIAFKDIADRLDGVSERDVQKACQELQKKYSGDCGLHLLIFNKKVQFCSNPAYSEQVSLVLNPIKERELSRSMLETAAIIAYKQPVTRIDLEELRGNSEYAIQNLLKLGVIEIVGRKDAVGRPVMFGTTDEFLKRFQIGSLDELPDYDQLMALIKQSNGTDSDDNYLYRKDEYVEGAKENVGVQIDLSSIPTKKGSDGDIDGGDGADFEFTDIGEDIPDFLLGEDDIDIV